jgi:mono/diheme cytochrome c family protein
METKSFLIALSLIFFATACNHRQMEPVMRPISLNQQQQRGQVIYMQHCQPCHPQGEGAAGWPLLQIPVPGVAYRFRIRDRAFALGLGKMPAFKRDKISRAEMDDLVSYIKRMRKNNEPATNMAFHSR